MRRRRDGHPGPASLVLFTHDLRVRRLEALRLDPRGEYVRRCVLGRDVHEPWRKSSNVAPGYPPPIVDHVHASARFRLLRRRVG